MKVIILDPDFWIVTQFECNLNLSFSQTLKKKKKWLYTLFYSKQETSNSCIMKYPLCNPSWVRCIESSFPFNASWVKPIADFKNFYNKFLVPYINSTCTSSKHMKFSKNLLSPSTIYNCLYIMTKQNNKW